jgi:hypothetical protein
MSTSNQGGGNAGGDNQNAGGGVLFTTGGTNNEANSGNSGGANNGTQSNSGGNNNQGTQGNNQQNANQAQGSWRDSLPDDLKSSAALNAIPDVPTLVKSYINAQKMIGADKIAVPTANASKEDWTAVFQKLGLPKTPEEYKVEVEKGMEFDQDFFTGFKKLAYENGVLPAQAKQLAEFLHKEDKKSRDKEVSDYQANVTREIKKLQGEWGEAYSENVAKAKAALNEFADKDTQEAIRKSGLGNNVHLLKVLAKAGATLAEDKIKGEGGSGGFKLTPAQAQAELDAIHGNMKHPYYDKQHSEHLAAKTKVKELHAVASWVPKNS